MGRKQSEWRRRATIVLTNPKLSVLRTGQPALIVETGQLDHESGSLDRDELEAMAAAKQRAAAEMHRIDTDGDGSISRVEFAAAGGECSERPHSTSRQTIIILQLECGD